MENDNTVKGFDLVLEKLGNYSKYNVTTYCLLLLVVYFYGLHQTTFVFVAPDINYRCNISECEDLDYKSPLVKYAIPTNKGQLSKCKRYAFKEDLRNSYNGTCAPELFDNSTATFCSSFIYSDEDSIVKDFNLACQNWKRTLLGTVNFAGNLAALPVIGIFSDKYGRKITLIVLIVTLGVIGVLKSFSINYEMLLVLEFLGSGLGLGAYTTAFVFAMELFQPKGRVSASTLLHITFSLGHVTFACLAWLLQSWRNLLRIMGGPTILFLSYFWIIDESARWLTSKQRTYDALKIIQKSAKVNNIDISNDVLSLLHEETGIRNSAKLKTGNAPETFLDAIKSSVIRKRLFVCSFLFITCNFVYYGLTINSISLAGNQYLNFVLVAIAEIPSNIISFSTLDKFGRKITLIAAYLLSGIFCIFLTFLSKDLKNWAIFFYILGMLCICVAFVSVYTFVSELFPTNVRQSMISTCSLFGRIGSMLSASTPLLMAYSKTLPAIIFGSLAVLAGLLVLTLPETSKMILPDTITDAENMCSKKLRREVLNSESI